MKRSIVLVFLYLATTTVAVANNSSFRESTLEGYNNRCNEVLKKKGYSELVIKNECNCEVDVINNNFTTFSLMIMGAKRLAGQEVLKKEDVADIKKKLGKCKSKYL